MQDNHHIDLLNATHLRDIFPYIAQVSQLELKTSGDYVAIITPGGTGYNYVAGVGENAADFLPLIDYFKQQNLSFVWFSYPLTPALEQTLNQQGLVHAAPVACMTCDLSKETHVEVNQNFEFVPVTTPDQFQAWCQILATTWNRSIEVTVRFYQGLYLNSRMQMFLARQGQNYVGCCLLDIQDDIAGCYWDCVRSEFRQQGIGRMMIDQRKAIAKAKGCKYIVAQCLDSSLGVYQKAGFEKGGSMALYRFEAS